MDRRAACVPGGYREPLEGRRIRSTVPEGPARLLIALKPDDRTSGAVVRVLPSIPWTYARSSDPSAWGKVEALLVGSVDRELGPFNHASTPSLRFVQSIYTGLDQFPFTRFPDSIPVAANGGAYAPFVAEHAVALALASAREIVAGQAQMRTHTLRPPPAIRLLVGRTAVILGYGAIGREIARRLAGFDIRIIGVNRTGRMAPGCSAMLPADRLKEALTEGDFVFDVRPLTRTTRGTIGAEELAAMRPQAIYVNVGRAATVDEEALYRHLVAHPDFRAALDPWWQEDFAKGTFASRFPFVDLPNFVGTPHSAGFGPATEQFSLERALENLARFFRGVPPRYVVDRREYLRPDLPG